MACKFRRTKILHLTNIFPPVCFFSPGFFQRTEKMVKNAFGNVLIFGGDKDTAIQGLFFWKGQSLIFEVTILDFKNSCQIWLLWNCLEYLTYIILQVLTYRCIYNGCQLFACTDIFWKSRLYPLQRIALGIDTGLLLALGIQANTCLCTCSNTHMPCDIAILTVRGKCQPCYLVAFAQIFSDLFSPSLDS